MAIRLFLKSVVFKTWQSVSFFGISSGFGNTEKPGRYDASRNILPGIYSPETVLIGNHTIRTVHLDGILYYRLKDILIAAGVYERKKRDTSDTWFKPYVYWLNDQTGKI